MRRNDARIPAWRPAGLGRSVALTLLVFSMLAFTAFTALSRPEDRAKPVPRDASVPPVLRGRWVLDASGAAIPPDSFRRGLQLSGLAWSQGGLWSVGDQRSELPGHLLRIDPRERSPGAVWLGGAPVRLEVPEGEEGEAFTQYRAIPNCDLEGLAVHPRRPSVLFAVTEDKVPWFVEIALSSEGHGEGQPERARIVRLVELVFPEGLAAWRDDPNFRLEGLSIDERAETAYFAFERAQDQRPRVLTASLAELRGDGRGEGRTVLRDLGVDFSSVGARADKPRALLNLNGLAWLRRGDRELLLAVARDQERVLVIDPVRRTVTRVLDLDLRSAEGEAIFWVSPEAIAVDEAAARVYLVNDPDSVRGNFRRRDEEMASGRFAEYAPLLFELDLETVLGARE